MPYPPTTAAKLAAVYEDLRWLADREHVRPARARAWYSAVWADALKTEVRIFSGRVSLAALQDVNGRLCLEHYNKLSESLTTLLTRHVQEKRSALAEFMLLIERCEHVNITTESENRRVQTAKGDYAAAQIQLVEWRDLPAATQLFLWRKKLHKKVANAHVYAPKPEA